MAPLAASCEQLVRLVRCRLKYFEIWILSAKSALHTEPVQTLTFVSDSVNTEWDENVSCDGVDSKFMGISGSDA